MSQPARTATVLGTLLVALAIAALWGWQALTAPFPGEEQSQETEACTETSVAAGERVRTEDVVVSVFNGSDRAGLAGATMEQLVARGFVEGGTGNAPVEEPIGRVQIWAEDKRDPAVRLVRKQFARARVVEGEDLGPGVVVVMGRAFSALEPPVESVRARQDTTYCST